MPFKNEPNQGLRFAVLGTGYWSTLQIPAWFEVGGVHLAAVYNRTLAKAETAARTFGIPRVYAEPEELFRREQLDFVDIIADTVVHAPLVFLAAKYRVPVICQKPMGPDLPTCRDMVRVCQQAGVPLLIHENFRWQPPFRMVKQALEEGHLGRPLRARIQLSYGGPATFEAQPFLKSMPHFQHTDMGSHLFDLARFLFGEAQSVYCAATRGIEGIAGEDVLSAILRIGDTLCACEVSTFLSDRVFVEGTRGSLRLDLENVLQLTTDQGTVTRDCKVWPRYAWTNDFDYKLHGGDCLHSIVLCHRHLLDCLKNGRAPESSGAENLKTMELVFASITSTETGEVVRLGT